MGAPKLLPSNFGSSASLKSRAGESLSRSAIAPRTDGSKVSLSNWQSEREKLLLRLCRCIEARAQRGQAIEKAARRVGRKWNGRAYKGEPRRKIRLSASRLTELYRKWARHHSARVFRLHYVGPTARKIPAAFLMEVARRAQSPNVFSLLMVLRGIRADFNRGKKIPGLGKLNRKNIPAPVPWRTAYRHFSGIDLSQRRVILRNIAQSMAQLSAIDRALDNRAKSALRKVER